MTNTLNSLDLGNIIATGLLISVVYTTSLAGYLVYLELTTKSPVYKSSSTQTYIPESPTSSEFSSSSSDISTITSLSKNDRTLIDNSSQTDFSTNQKSTQTDNLGINNSSQTENIHPSIETQTDINSVDASIQTGNDLLQVKYQDGTTKSLTYLEKLTPLQIDKMLIQSEIGIENIQSEFDIENTGDGYDVKTIDQLIIMYHIIPEDILPEVQKEKPRRKGIKQSTLSFSGFNLSTTMDLSQWGYEIERNEQHILIQKYDSQLIYRVKLLDNAHNVEILRRGKVVLHFIDQKEEGDPMNTFVRTLKFQKHHFKKGKLILKKISRKTPFLSSD